MNLDNLCALFSTWVPWLWLYGPINSYHSFCWSHLTLCHHNTGTLDMYVKKYYFGKIFLTNLQLCELRQFLCIVFNMSSMVVPIRADQLTQFCSSHLTLCHHNTDTLDMCMKIYYFGKIIFNKFAAL